MLSIPTPVSASPSSATGAKKTANEDGWRHVSIVLDPINPDYDPIEVTGEDESPVAVVAELIEVIGPQAPLS